MRPYFPLLALGLALLACGTDSSTDMVFDAPADGDDGGDGETTFSFIQQNIFDRSCALSGCHAGQQYPDLSAGRAYGNIVGGASSDPQKPLIEPGEPDDSYLYLKVTNAAGISGARMPRGAPPLSDELIGALRAWIERGAPND